MNVLDKFIHNALTNREVGQIPVSIGTSLALEGAYGVLEDNRDENPVINRVDVLYVNVRTLIRNIVGSVESEIAGQLHAEDILQVLLNEIQIIAASVKQITNGRVEMVPYYCTFESIKKTFPHALLKELKADKAPRMAFAFSREENVLADLDQQGQWLHVRKFDIDFDQDAQRKALILTNYAADLLQRYKFQTLTLVESHTGAIKSHALWNTKLTNGKELRNIPFDRMTIQMFGDNSNLFSPMPIKVRRFILDVATKNKWTPLTTKAYILECIHKLREPELEALVLNLYGGNR